MKSLVVTSPDCEDTAAKEVKHGVGGAPARDQRAGRGCPRAQLLAISEDCLHPWGQALDRAEPHRPSRTLGSKAAKHTVSLTLRTLHPHRVRAHAHARSGAHPRIHTCAHVRTRCPSPPCTELSRTSRFPTVDLQVGPPTAAAASRAIQAIPVGQRRPHMRLPAS